ncbi:RagB/SusD family nutrient uptake outer membrane protein [Flexithrix dorotheae]|uniref:RagB/SusD family nutrient uptake outer membrane protein n=1 Tax=Flexithrix dorotheae TaxID=70993 RepID=UPI001FE15F0C|nr:RagB/SusD family nutrient uptake outer membrane protein [Flexithrix dorotheae]
MNSINRYIILSVFFFSLTGIMTSCEDKLEQYPENQFASGSFWTNETNALIALTGVYRGAIEYGTSVNPPDWWTYSGIVFLEHATDNAYDRRGDNANQNRLTDGTLLPNNGVLSSYWGGSYKRIAISNDFLENVVNVPMEEAKINRMAAEARFIRATQYFYLSQFWGGVPLVTTTLTPDEANVVNKAPKSEVVQFIIGEFSEIVDDLPRFSELTDAEQGRASKQAALAFLGRIYLAEKQFAQAAATYKQIIDFGDNMIDPDYQSIFLPSKENSAENIFSSLYYDGIAGNALPQHTLPASSGGWHIVNPLGSLADAYDWDDGTPFSYDDPRYNSRDMGANRDPRFRYTLTWDGCDFQGRTLVVHPDSTNSLDQLTYSKQATRTGYGLRKYLDESYNGGLRLYGGNLPVIRYAEVLLSYLEAELEAGSVITQDLLDNSINLVRGRESVNMPPITETDPAKLREIIRKERRVEMAMEGTRLWDLLRWEIAGDVLQGDFWGAPFPDSELYESTSKKLDPNFRWYVTTKNFRKGIDEVWPIPESETNINPNLTN